MKLPITDKFLWKLYRILEEVDEFYEDFAIYTHQKIWYPDLYKLRQREAKEIGRKEFNALIYYLKKKGYIKIKNLEQKEAVLLTKKGLDKVFKTKLKSMKKKKRKDRKWQMVIFDIPEKKRISRDIFRENLQILGYKMLQRSIWICPYDVGKETEEIIRRYSLDPYIRIFLVKEVEV